MAYRIFQLSWLARAACVTLAVPAAAAISLVSGGAAHAQERTAESANAFLDQAALGHDIRYYSDARERSRSEPPGHELVLIRDGEIKSTEPVTGVRLTRIGAAANCGSHLVGPDLSVAWKWVNRIQKHTYTGFTVPGAAPHHRLG